MSPDRKQNTGPKRLLPGRTPILMVILLGTAAIALALRGNQSIGMTPHMQLMADQRVEGTLCTEKLDLIVRELVGFYRARRQLPTQAEFQAILSQRVDPQTVCPGSPKTTIVMGPDGYFFVLACTAEAPCENLIEPYWEIASTHIDYLREEVSFQNITARPWILFAKADVKTLADMEGLGDDDEQLMGFIAMKRDIIEKAANVNHLRLASLRTGEILFQHSGFGRP